MADVYVLRLTAHDGVLTRTDAVTIMVSATPTLTPAPEPVSYLLWTCTGEACGEMANAHPDVPAVAMPGTESPIKRDGETGTVAIRYYYVNGLRVAENRNGAWTWTHSDHLHSATVITDAQGAEIRRLAYAAFGEQAENVGTGDAPTYTYTAKEADASGLMYYGARYYDPALARFITADMLDDVGPQGLNRYSYALNNPVIYNDPTGHFINGPNDREDPDSYGSITGSQEQLGNNTAHIHSGTGLSLPLREFDARMTAPITIDNTVADERIDLGDGMYVDGSTMRVLAGSQGVIQLDPHQTFVRRNPVSRYAGDAIMVVTSFVSSDYKATNCNVITRDCYSDRDSFDRRFGVFTDVAMMAATSKVEKLSKSFTTKVKDTSRELVRKKYPTHLNRGGKPQPYDPVTARWLSYNANPGLKMSPLARGAAGVGIALAEGEGATSGAMPIGVAGNVGYRAGQVLSFLKNLFF